MSKFKEGDRVKLRDESVEAYGYYVGPRTIERDDHIGWARDGSVPGDYQSRGGDTYWYVHEESLELVKEVKPSHKFKVGDRVEVFGNRVGNDTFKAGTVTDLNGDSYYYVTDDKRTAYKWSVHIDDMCLLSDEVKPSHKFKVSDVVIGNDMASDLYTLTTKGWKGTVTHVFDDHFNCDRFRLQYDAFDLYAGEGDTTGTLCEVNLHDVIKDIKNQSEHLMSGRVGHFEGFDYYVGGGFKSKPKKTIMRTVTTMMKKLLDSDTQTLIKAGYLDSELDLTVSCKQALATILFGIHKEELVKSAQEKIDEEEKAK